MTKLFLASCMASAVALSALAAPAAKEEKPSDAKSADAAKAKKALVIVVDSYQDLEFDAVKKALDDAEITVTIGSNTDKEIDGMMGGKVKPDKKLKACKAADYDAVIFIGGPGTSVLFDDKDAHRVAKEAAAKKKILAAICLAPNILANAGLLKGKNATGYDKETVKEKGGKVPKDKSVVQDGLIITADGPEAADEFAAAIIEALSK